jgi:uncharacterized protein YciI
MTEPAVHHVVIHRPGVAARVDFREQPGVKDHVAHYHALREAGKLERGGPFLTPDGGGLTVATADITKLELEEFAASDPAVRSGLLTFEIRPWYVPMRRNG